MNPEEFYQKYLKEPINMEKTMQMIDDILLLETGKPPEFYNMHSMEEVEKSLGIEHYVILVPREVLHYNGERRIQYEPLRIVSKEDEELLMNW
jgi:hypothetical protein